MCPDSSIIHSLQHGKKWIHNWILVPKHNRMRIMFSDPATNRVRVCIHTGYITWGLGSRSLCNPIPFLITKQQSPFISLLALSYLLPYNQMIEMRKAFLLTPEMATTPSKSSLSTFLLLSVAKGPGDEDWPSAISLQAIRPPLMLSPSSSPFLVFVFVYEMPTLSASGLGDFWRVLVHSVENQRIRFMRWDALGLGRRLREGWDPKN